MSDDQNKIIILITATITYTIHRKTVSIANSAARMWLKIIQDPAPVKYNQLHFGHN